MLHVTTVEGVAVKPRAYPTREAAKAAGIPAGASSRSGRASTAKG